MYLLYLDDAGSAANSQEEYFVLAGIAVFETQTNWLSQELDRIAENIDPANPRGVEFHASEIFSRRSPPWKNMEREDAQGVIKAVLKVLARSHNNVRAFACAVHKGSYPGSDPVELAFEDLCSRFNIYLGRLRAAGDIQQGLLILDKSTYETTLQKLARDFQTRGTQWGAVIRNIVDTPFFVDSHASRLIQIADHVAYSVFRRYNARDTQYFDIFAAKFDEADGIIHGLAHKQTVEPMCMCPACLSRRISQSARISNPDNNL
ncbi:DUF3800 domain-containing protein [[Phormidium] sp. ETS-05]|uniref:DUF3800 domain-containing protein n=1 Tax=[Phormidium] sp. ETS-05 TaxID=222819 RepID=UPI0018EF0205|nr:DUF3800 domain-containing protein [[Phormidium] sp. ETS-05]